MAIAAAPLAAKASLEGERAIRAAGAFLVKAAEHPTFTYKTTRTKTKKSGELVTHTSGVDMPAWLFAIAMVGAASFLSTNMETLSGGKYTGSKRPSWPGVGGTTIKLF